MKLPTLTGITYGESTVTAQGREISGTLPSVDLGRFARCMGFPNAAEAGACATAATACVLTAFGGPIPYGLCVGAACGLAGAKHAYRCAKEAGII